MAAEDPDDYSRSHPTAAELVVEVADTSLWYDREVKAAVYARAGIPEYWIQNLVSWHLEIHREPAGARYASWTVLTPSDKVSPLFAPEDSILVARLFPKR